MTQVRAQFSNRLIGRVPLSVQAITSLVGQRASVRGSDAWDGSLGSVRVVSASEGDDGMVQLVLDATAHAVAALGDTDPAPVRIGVAVLDPDVLGLSEIIPLPVEDPRITRLVDAAVQANPQVPQRVFEAMGTTLAALDLALRDRRLLGPAQIEHLVNEVASLAVLRLTEARSAAAAMEAR